MIIFCISISCILVMDVFRRSIKNLLCIFNEVKILKCDQEFGVLFTIAPNMIMC